jgi:hypothetical protein
MEQKTASPASILSARVRDDLRRQADKESARLPDDERCEGTRRGLRHGMTANLGLATRHTSQPFSDEATFVPAEGMGRGEEIGLKVLAHDLLLGSENSHVSKTKTKPDSRGKGAMMQMQAHTSWYPHTAREVVLFC